MAGDRIAVIDLGSNTFHLLICEITADQSWIEIHKEREYVKLASGGIGVIDDMAQQRAIDSMARFAQQIKLHQVNKVKAIGTAALRESENGEALAQKLFEITGIPVEIIDGYKEAFYILAGIQSVLPALHEFGLIMDIGGGSVEFILYKENRVPFAQSFKVGVAVLHSIFHKSDPISHEEIIQLEEHLASILAPLTNHLKQVGKYYLIGASGSFEVLYDVLPKKEIATHWAELDATEILTSMDAVIHASSEERRLMKEIPPERIDYIVVAYLLIRFIYSTHPPQRLYYCEFAMKEGIVAEMMD